MIYFSLCLRSKDYIETLDVKKGKPKYSTQCKPTETKA